MDDWRVLMETESRLSWLFVDIHRLLSRAFEAKVRHLGLTRVQLRVLFTILIGVLSAAASLLVDLNDPFRGNFRITPSADQLLVIRQTLTEDGLQAEGRLGCAMAPARAPVTPSTSTAA